MYSNPQRSSIRFVHARTKSIPHVPSYEKPKISRLNQHSNALYLSFSENRHSRAKDTIRSSLDVTRKSTDQPKRLTKPSLPDQKGLTLADPTNGKFAILAAKAHMDANNLSKALDTISSFMKTNRPFPDGQQIKGLILMQMGNFAEAEKEFEELIGSGQKGFNSVLPLSECLFKRSLFEKAIKNCKNGLQMGISDSGTLQGLRIKEAECLVELGQYSEAESKLHCLLYRDKVESSQVCYYLGMSQKAHNKLHEALLHFELGVRFATDELFGGMCLKKILYSYLFDYQLYEAEAILIRASSIDRYLLVWQQTVDGCLAVIRQHYEVAIVSLSKAIVTVEKSIPNAIKQRIGLEIKNEGTLPARETMKHSKALFHSPSGGMRQGRAKSMKASMTQISPLMVSNEQVQLLYPMIKLFLAYSFFFVENYQKALHCYDEFQLFTTYYSGTHLDVSYNKMLCQALIHSTNSQMPEGLIQYEACINLFELKSLPIPIEPILYSVAHTVQLSLSKQKDIKPLFKDQLVWLNSYIQVVEQNWLGNYFKGILELAIGNFESAAVSFQKSLKIVDQCPWRLLYLKGVAELSLGNYYTAIRQFSAALLREKRPQIHLGLAASLLLQSKERKESDFCRNTSPKKASLDLEVALKNRQQTKSETAIDSFLESSFENLQKFIQTQPDQDIVSLWVSKLLFASQAYVEAAKSLDRVKTNSRDKRIMTSGLAIINGAFHEAGPLGTLFISAFEGELLGPEEQVMALDRVDTPSFQCDGDIQLATSYHKWLMAIHLYASKKYDMLVRHLQKLIFRGYELEQPDLRYSLAVTYLLQGQQKKAMNLFKALSEHHTNLERIVSMSFQKDQCLPGLDPSVAKISQFLPFRPARLLADSGQITVYVKPAFPMPPVPQPDLVIRLTPEECIQPINFDTITKKLQAPWIRRKHNGNIQFTDQIAESDLDIAIGDQASLSLKKLNSRENFLD